MKWRIPLWWISACIAGEMLEGPVELMDHVLYVQGKGCLGSAHTGTLDLAWTCFEPNSPTHIQETQTLPRDLFSTKSCALPAKENKHQEKERSYDVTRTDSPNSISPFPREQSKWSKVSLCLKGFSVEFLDFSFTTCLNNRIKFLICLKQKSSAWGQ